MEKNMEQNKPTAKHIRKRFDETLGQHMERMIGTRYGIGGLQVNLAALACLTLLTEQETEIESFPSSPPDRYTREKLFAELAEIDIDPDEDIDTAVQDMIRKGYIDVDDNGLFSAEKPAISMSQLLDRLFPGILGMNFIAYMIQTMDEARSGRKDLDFAISQFNQMLQMQGVPLKKEKIEARQEKRPGSTDEKEAILQRVDEPRKVRQQIMQKGGLKLSDLYRRLPPQKRSKDSNVSPSRPDESSSDGGSAQFEIKEVEAGEFFDEQIESSERSPEMDQATETRAPEIVEQVEDKEAREVTFSVPELIEQEGSLLSHQEVEGAGTESIQIEEALPGAGIKDEPDIITEDERVKRVEDDIERKISAFEEDLAMICPICGTGNIKDEETSAGKFFYQCSNRNCNFISWGKPYHLACPQCKNPFLVEATDRTGNIILKCPRSTCRHWQNLPGEITDSPQEKELSTSQTTDSPVTPKKPRRRVVRRRKVVRRKR